MEEESTLRHRKPHHEEPKPEQDQEETSESESENEGGKTRSSKEIDEEDPWDGYTPYVDVLRVITFLLLASCGLSYVISGGKSWFWGMKNKPDYLTVKYYKELITGPVELSLPAVIPLLTPTQPPPTYLTLDELKLYDGTDPDRPLLLAINGTIYDVSNGRRMYGPGGSYHYFAATDAARGFVTGCFAEDRTADLRGMEEAFLPLDDPETDAHWTPEELAALKEKELAEAKEHAHKALLHWVNFFANSKKYSKYGYVSREDDWLEKEEPKVLCDQVQATRKKRKIPGKEED
ncbi:Cytochrome b5 heme-binding domain-containing protein [Fusarium keratoplasticum]|uniref:Cytochrome b5 heme-binding domain-containing protein n=1 Tax=Fusarium keratoplasticum TaxID=1328300 RepID=A0ACC0R0X0_9HYPO|nr:Cytochrome b5 heme-binding domain-containing protein [Fusarium keratoplasticum]KAI8671024.1 Cytochrome b5 heme-binding domain-containing protein [Fusarium keratoplasticum]